MEKRKIKLSEYKDQINDWTQFKDLTLKEAIMFKCMDCCCYQKEEVKLSSCNSCPLYMFKEYLFNKNDLFEKNPFKRNMSDEDKKLFAERMKQSREQK